MNEWIGGVECHQCIYLGEYDDNTDDKKRYMLTMLMRCKENCISLKRNNIKYKIKIVLTANRKKVEIISESLSTINAMLSIIHDILRFENMFEGLFFPLVSFTADEKDYTEEVQKKQLDYYKSQKRYAYIPIVMDNQKYRKLCRNWLKEEDKNKIIHPVFLHSVYLDGMLVEIRMALLLETFEPIAEDLHNRRIITLVKPPTKTYTNRCKQCGSYIYKFSLMYRYIMLQEIGIEDKVINPYITEWVENFNEKYPQLRV